VPDDVVDLIIDDHRLFEDLLRQVRNVEADREAALSELSAVLVAHAEAEEREVYPELRYKADEVTREEVEHGTEEHAEGHAALLRVLEIDDLDSEEFGEAVEGLTKALAHHLDEEERTILNPAREEVSDVVRERLGIAFKQERHSQLDADCGAIENVRRLVEESTHAET
jgi:hemerythrin-like domain-containing protein